MRPESVPADPLGDAVANILTEFQPTWGPLARKLRIPKILPHGGRLILHKSLSFLPLKFAASQICFLSYFSSTNGYSEE